MHLFVDLLLHICSKHLDQYDYINSMISQMIMKLNSLNKHVYILTGTHDIDLNCGHPDLYINLNRMLAVCDMELHL